MSGRPRKTNAQKRLAGNPGKRQIKEQVKPADDMPDCPAHLDEDAQREWRRLAPELHKLGLLTQVDRTAFAAYCQAWSTWSFACKMISTGGAVLKSDKGNLYLSPWQMVSSQALEQVNKFGAQFGLTPGSRRKLDVKPPEAEDPFDTFMKSKAK
jgi:P27 family predicted phage terminase small subunit